MGQRCEVKVRDIMNPEVVTCPPTARISDVARVMRQRNIGMIPIVDGSKLLGVVTDRDITIDAVAAGNIDRPINDILHPDPVCVRPEAPIEDAAKLMAQHRVRRLCVSSDAGIQGVLSLDDLPYASDSNLVADVLRKLHPHQKSRV